MAARRTFSRVINPQVVAEDTIAFLTCSIVGNGPYRTVTWPKPYSKLIKADLDPE